MPGDGHQFRDILQVVGEKYGGMNTSMMARVKELELENARLKKIYAEERLKAEILNEALTKKW